MNRAHTSNSITIEKWPPIKVCGHQLRTQLRFRHGQAKLYSRNAGHQGVLVGTELRLHPLIRTESVLLA